MHKSNLLIHTKLTLPSLRKRVVARPRLQEQILYGLQCPLTLVIAPAGFGKTILVASSILEGGIPVAWLSLELLLIAAYAVSSRIQTKGFTMTSRDGREVIDVEGKEVEEDSDTLTHQK